MDEWASFGDKARFEIAVRWAKDDEPRERRPALVGWSTGELRLTVSHHVLTRNEHAGRASDATKWYLLPIFAWLAENWVSLFHEERFSWRENSPAPAATATFLALRRSFDDAGDSEDQDFDRVRSWWARHSLRAADASALYPDVFMRRFRDEIEVSWTARQPVHSPDGFRFNLMPGVATLPVADVAEPLWEALNWIAPSATAAVSPADRQSVKKLEQQILRLKRLPTSTLQSSYLPASLLSEVSAVRAKIHLTDRSTRLKKTPAIGHLDDAVLMFGGVNPDIGARDVRTLMDLLAASRTGHESPELHALVDEKVGAPAIAPFQEGYDLAEELLEECSLPGDQTFVDIRALLKKLGVKVLSKVLRTSTIRGVAIAGADYTPTILINKTSDYNTTDSGKRFTLAHELFHLLYDRTRARRITHVSGSWAPPSVEKRANAFAAMFLMPRILLGKAFSHLAVDEQSVSGAAESMQVGTSALVEHLYNMSMIDEPTRDRLRVAGNSR